MEDNSVLYKLFYGIGYWGTKGLVKLVNTLILRPISFIYGSISYFFSRKRLYKMLDERFGRDAWNKDL